MIRITIPLILLMWGCSNPITTAEREIDRIIRIDTLRVIKTETKYDTVWIKDGNGESVRYIVKTDTLWKRIMIKSKPDTIYVPVVDTVTVTRTEIKTVESNDFFKGVTLMGVLYVIGGIAVLGFLGNIFRR